MQVTRMKKSTKNMLVVIFLIITFGMSSIAFIITGISSNLPQPKQLEDFVVAGDLNAELESRYFSNGYTFVKFYYANNYSDYINQIPEAFKTNYGQKQVIVQKYPHYTGNSSTFIKISNLNGEKEITNPDDKQIFDSLCDIVLSSPIDCGFRNSTIRS